MAKRGARLVRRGPDASVAVAKLAKDIPIAGLVGEGIAIMKNAEIMGSFWIEPPDLTFADEARQVDVVNYVRNILRRFAGGYTLYLDAFRREVVLTPERVSPDGPALTRVFEAERRLMAPAYTTEFFVTVCKDTAETKPKPWQLLFRRRETDGEAVGHLHGEVEQFAEELREIGNMLRSTFKRSVRLDNDELLTYLHAALTPWNPHRVRTPEPAFYLDDYLADGTVYLDSDLRYNDHSLCMGGIRDFPAATHAGLMARILSLNTEFRLTTRFLFADKEKVKKEIASKRKGEFQKRKSLGGIFQETVMKEASQLEDTEALALTADASAAMAELACGMSFGQATTTVQTWGRDFATARARLEAVMKAVNEEGFLTKMETLNAPPAWLGSIPGNMRYNARRHMISTANLAHFFVLSSPWTGDPVNRHMREVTGEGEPFLIGKTGNSPFYVPSHEGDVGNRVVFGPTGAGKSTYLAADAVAWLKYPGARVWFFDKDRSSYWATERSGGVFVEINREENGLKLNPFARADRGAEEQKFLTDLVVNFLDMVKYPLAPESAGRVHAAVVSVAQAAPENRGWSLFVNQVQDVGMREALRPFLPGGHYYDLFKDGADEIAQARWVTFEMGELMRTPGDPIVPLMCQYLFHRIEEQFSPARPTRVYVDEAWAFLDSPAFAQITRNLLKTARKKGAAVVLSTQEVADARASTVFQTVITNCPTKILLPNSLATQAGTAALYREIGLSDADLRILASATPKRDYLYVSPTANQLFRLDLNADELSLLTSRELTPRSARLLAAAQAERRKEESA